MAATAAAGLLGTPGGRPPVPAPRTADTTVLTGSSES